MGLLKKDIDRRVRKIRSMLGGVNIQHKMKCDKNVQTEVIN